MKLDLCSLVVAAALVGSVPAGAKNTPFGGDVKLLQSHGGVVVLSDRGGQGLVAVSPRYQGRVMTSTSGGQAGDSYGWINHALIRSGNVLEHFNPIGGEDRFWLGPEGGQFGLYFPKGPKFDLAHWYVPAALDTEPFKVVGKGRDRVLFRRTLRLKNTSGAVFDVQVDRTVRVLEPAAAWQDLGVAPVKGVKMVAYQSDNRITNVGKDDWTDNTGLPSIWILGMFNPSPRTTIVIPFKSGAVADLGPYVNDAYFGKVPPDRLVIRPSGVLFFRGDGKRRSKIGISPNRAKPLLGSYDATNQVLTLVQYTLPEGASQYVNSMWEIQKDPFGGDVVNSYNDGPPAPGAKPLGPFYELESSSPAAALSPGQSASHLHRTIHIQGPPAALDRIARATLGVGLKEIAAAFPGGSRE